MLWFQIICLKRSYRTKQGLLLRIEEKRNMKSKEPSERNVFLDLQIQNQIMQVDNFIKLCEHAAKKDDGKVIPSKASCKKP